MRGERFQAMVSDVRLRFDGRSGPFNAAKSLAAAAAPLLIQESPMSLDRLDPLRIASLAIVGTAALTASADAGLLGFAGFSRIGSNGNRIIDVVAVVSNSNDRLLNIANSFIESDTGFIQLGGTGNSATRGWKPTAALTNARSSEVDSFVTIGVDGGAAYGGEYYASGLTGADGYFTTGWTTAAGTSAPPLDAGWFISPPNAADNVAESLANFSGQRFNLGSAGQGNYGIWCAHLVMAGNTATCNFTAKAFVKDGVTGATAGFTFGGAVPAPGAVAVLALAGLSASRRRKA